MSYFMFAQPCLDFLTGCECVSPLFGLCQWKVVINERARGGGYTDLFITHVSVGVC